jgi:hypothetical protein
MGYDLGVNGVELVHPPNTYGGPIYISAEKASRELERTIDHISFGDTDDE